MNLLLILAIVFGVLVLIRIANVAQMASELSGTSEEEEQEKSNRWNSLGYLLFMPAFFAVVIYTTIKWGKLTLPQAASEHGADVDSFMNINWMVLYTVFFVTQFLLFTFAYRFRYKKGRRSFYFHDNNKLEALWTIVPTIVLSGLIVTGLVEWNRITDREKAAKGIKIQVYAKQFDFTARYAGNDNELAGSYFKNITDVNPLGLDTLDKHVGDDRVASELVMPVGEEIELVINSRDVIHSVYLPHFRVQMNAVPGMTTRFHFKPTITTAKMKEITGNDKFEYILLCNKICGVAHYNMKMPVRVVEKDEYNSFLAGTKMAYTKSEAAEPAPVAAPADSTVKPMALK